MGHGRARHRGFLPGRVRVTHDGGVAARPRRPLRSWPLLRQLTGPDHAGVGDAVRSPATDAMRSRTADATTVRSVCPYCAVGCGQLVHVRDGRVLHIEGDPDSPISRGRLCPKGSASPSLVGGDHRLTRVRYRRPFGRDWEDLDLETAMDMIADRVVAARDATWEQADDEGRPLNRTLGVASLGGATLDNEENYLLKKLFTSLGIVAVENQARI